MRQFSGGLLALALLSGSAIAAPTTKETLDGFQFFGRWAPNCEAPPALDNVTRTVTTTDAGQVVFIESSGNEYQPNAYIVLDARRKGRHSLMVRIEFNHEIVQDLTMIRQDGRIRTMSNRRLTDDQLLVHDGVVRATRTKTPWLQRCSK